MSAVSPPLAGSLEHEAFFYDSERQYVEVLAPLLDEALASGDLAMVVVPDARARALASALGDHASQVQRVAADAWYDHPVATIAAYDARLRSLPPGRRAVVVGEVEFGERAAHWTIWTRYEAALNEALRRYPARIVCPYDRRRLVPSVIEDGHRTHPALLDAGGSRPSGGYVPAGQLAGLLPATVEIPDIEPDVDLPVVALQELWNLRKGVAAAAARAGLGADRVAELTLAVNEVATNALSHGGGPVRLKIWVTAGSLTCVVSDGGPGTDPLTGMAPPAAKSESGYGLWLFRLLFDRSDLRRGEHGFTVAASASR
ncbi:MAG: anti-sigma factor RsbA family regulatory protein [Solirubrobacteraceae bacterium]